MADKINIPIESTYDPKGADKALADAKKIDQADPTLEIEADTKDAKRDIDGLMSKVDKLDAEAGTILLTSNATKVARDITDLIIDLDRLDANDPQVDVKATQINDLKADLDQIETKIREVNGTTLDIDTTSSVGGLQKVRGEADQSRSVLANLVGNATQDLGALGGVAGTAGVAIGQLGEYATEGNIKLSNLAKVAGPMAALAVGVELLNQGFAAAAASKAFDAGNVKQYLDAIVDGTDFVASFNDEIRETNELQFRAKSGGGPLGMFSSTQDLLPILERANIDIGQLNTIIQDYITTQDFGGAANDRWRASLEAAGVSELDAIKIVQAARQEAAARIAATEKNARVTDLLGESQAELAEKARLAAEAEQARGYAAEASRAAIEGQVRMEEEAADQLDRVNQLLYDQADALNAQVEAAVGAADSHLAYQQALDGSAEATAATVEAQAALDEATRQHGEGSKEAADATKALDDAVRSERDGMISAANAAVRYGEDQNKAIGKTATATEKIDVYNTSLLDQARNATPAARKAITDYIIEANQVPPDKVTDIRAAIEAGDFATAKRLLDEASETRTAAITADADTAAANRELDKTAEDRTSHINVKINGITAIGGGKFRTDSGLILQSAPTPPDGGPAPTPLPVGGGVSGVTNVTVNVPRGYHRDVLEDARKAARRSGGLYRRNHR